MTDLHPEELLHRAAHGGLDAGDKGRLRAHLGQCASCRLELSVRRAASHHTRSRGGDAQRLRRLADLALATASAPMPAAPRPRISAWTGAALGAVVGLLLLVALSLGHRFGDAWLRNPEASRSQAEATRAPKSVGGAAVERRPSAPRLVEHAPPKSPATVAPVTVAVETVDPVTPPAATPAPANPRRRRRRAPVAPSPLE
ncbi:MAG: zf-HC2 domain-containing protein, partial [Myxococcota bacterium]